MCASAAREVEAYIAVGSNIEPARNIEEAVRRLSREVQVVAVSTFYRTEALGPPGQPVYLNGVVRVMTEASARELKFGVLRAIETELGRVRSDDKFASRPIDLDLLVHGEAVIDEPDLRVPDGGIVERAFVAVPLLELAPGLVAPGSGRRLAASRGVGAVEGLTPEPAFTERLRRVLGGGQETTRFLP